MRESTLEASYLDLGDSADLSPLQGVEYHHLVDAVDELRSKVICYFAHHRRLHALIVGAAGQRLDGVRAQIRSHDDDGIAEIDRAAVTIGQTTIVQHL